MHSVELFVEVHDVKRHAIVDVQCVVQLSTSSLVFISSCFPSRLLLSTLSSQFSYCSSSSNSLPVAIFHICFHCILTALLGVVFTPPVVYSSPPSAVNDPTVTKQVNSRKSCLEEVSPITYLSGFPDQSVLGTSSW